MILVGGATSYERGNSVNAPGSHLVHSFLHPKHGVEFWGSEGAALILGIEGGVTSKLDCIHRDTTGFVFHEIKFKFYAKRRIPTCDQV